MLIERNEMVILGLGSNIGRRLNYLRAALLKLKQCGQLDIDKISSTYTSDALLPEEAPATWNKAYYNIAISCKTTLKPLALLKVIKAIEAEVGRIDAKRWSPRVIDIDILAWDDYQLESPDLTIPHKGLLDRPFALYPLCELTPNWVHPQTLKTAREHCAHWGSPLKGRAPFATRAILKRCDTPRIMGIVNLSQDSFSEDGITATSEVVLARVEQLYRDGADIIDIGLESTGPDSTSIPAEKQWRILEPVLHGLNALWRDDVERPLISIDTYSADLAEKAIVAGVDWINDVSAGLDKKMWPLIAEHNVHYVLNHNLGIPARRESHLPIDVDPLVYLKSWFIQQLENLQQHQITAKQIIIDPGINFGKTLEQARETLQGVDVFKSLECPILVGHSRKSICSWLKPLNNDIKDLETSVISTQLAQLGIDYLRVHNVAYTLRALNAYYKLL